MNRNQNKTLFEHPLVSIKRSIDERFYSKAPLSENEVKFNHFKCMKSLISNYIMKHYEEFTEDQQDAIHAWSNGKSCDGIEYRQDILSNPVAGYGMIEEDIDYGMIEEDIDFS